MSRKARIHPSGEPRTQKLSSSAEGRVRIEDPPSSALAKAKRGSSEDRRHWLWLSFGDAQLEREYLKFSYARERTSMMVASANLLVLAFVMIVLAFRSASWQPTLGQLITWIVPQLVLIGLHSVALVASIYRRITTSQIVSVIYILHAIAFQPLWINAWQTGAAGASVELVVLQSMALMLYPTPIWLTCFAISIGLFGLICGIIAIGLLSARASDIYTWISMITTYASVCISGWVYSRIRQKALRRLFLLSRRRDTIFNTLDNLGLMNEVAGFAVPIPLNRPDTATVRKKLEAANERDQLARKNSIDAAGGRTRPTTAKSVATASRYSGEFPLDAHRESKNTQPDKSLVSLDLYDSAPPRSRPPTAVMRAFAKVGNALEDAKMRAHQANSYPLNRQALDPECRDEDLNFIFAIFLGQAPWPPSGERRYLRHQAQHYSSNFMTLMVRLCFANFITAVVDHLDRASNQDQLADSNTLQNHLLLQLVPFTAIPLTSVCFAFVLWRMNLFMWYQPLVILTFSSLAAAYLLGPMELLSMIYPDLMPQSKMTAYLFATIIMSGQTGLIVARSFVAWCFSVLFLGLAHIPLVLSWGISDGDGRNAPFYMGIQVILLMLGLSAHVRAFEALSREIYEVMHAVRVGATALATGSRGGKYHRAASAAAFAGRAVRLGRLNDNEIRLEDPGDDAEYHSSKDISKSQRSNVRSMTVDARGVKHTQQKGKRGIHAVIDVEPLGTLGYDEDHEFVEPFSDFDNIYNRHISSSDHELDLSRIKDTVEHSDHASSIYRMYDGSATDEGQEAAPMEQPERDKALKESLEVLEELVSRLNKGRNSVVTTDPHRIASVGGDQKLSNLEKLNALLEKRDQWLIESDSENANDINDGLLVAHQAGTEIAKGRGSSFDVRTGGRSNSVGYADSVGSIRTMALHQTQNADSTVVASSQTLQPIGKYREDPVSHGHPLAVSSSLQHFFKDLPPNQSNHMTSANELTEPFNARKASISSMTGSLLLLKTRMEESVREESSEDVSGVGGKNGTHTPNPIPLRPNFATSPVAQPIDTTVRASVSQPKDTAKPLTKISTEPDTKVEVSDVTHAQTSQIQENPHGVSLVGTIKSVGSDLFRREQAHGGSQLGRGLKLPLPGSGEEDDDFSLMNTKQSIKVAMSSQEVKVTSGITISKEDSVIGQVGHAAMDNIQASPMAPWFAPASGNADEKLREGTEGGGRRLKPLRGTH